MKEIWEGCLPSPSFLFLSLGSLTNHVSERCFFSIERYAYLFDDGIHSFYACRSRRKQFGCINLRWLV